MLSLRAGFLRKAKGYKKHGISAVLFVFDLFGEMACLSAYRGRFIKCNLSKWDNWFLRSFLSGGILSGQDDKNQLSIFLD